ncbi:SDR family NAD(P)-dependent oxidoreductase [Myxococcota bacterium]
MPRGLCAREDGSCRPCRPVVRWWRSKPPRAEVVDALSPHQAAVSVASINAPASVVISGPEAAVMPVVQGFAARGVRTKRLTVFHAFHSSLMNPMLAPFREVAETLLYQAPSMPLVSNLSGTWAEPEIASADYWVRHARQPVRFSEGVQTMHAAGANAFLELGPRSVLLPMVSACLPSEKNLLMASLRAGRSEPQAVLEALGQWYSQGGVVDPCGLFPSGGGRVVLPTYPWQRQHYWTEVSWNAKEGEASHESDPGAALRRLIDRGLLSEPARIAVPEILAKLEDERLERRRAGELGSLFYEIVWHSVAPAQVLGSLNGSWALVGPPTALAGLDPAVRRAGGSPLLVSGFEVLSQLLAGGVLLAGLLHLVEAGTEMEEQVLEMAQLLAKHVATAPRVWWITRGAVGTSPTEPPARPDQAAVWGIARAFALECPRNWGGLIDLPADVQNEPAVEGNGDRQRTAADDVLDDRMADRVVALLSAMAGEDQFALRANEVLVPRLVVSRPIPSGPWPLSTRGTVLVTGGLGGLGLQVARWLVRRGTRHLLLVGRRGLDTPGVEQAVAELSAFGAQVRVVAADVTDRTAMTQVLQRVDPPLSAVFHAAGIADATPLPELTRPRLREVLAAKRAGTRLIDQLTRQQPMDAFVCFSSVAGLWGTGAAYAAGNVYLDAWAQTARARGQPALSVSWGPWASEGMADEIARKQLARRGVHALSPECALRALERILRGAHAHIVVADVDWERFRAATEVRGRRLLSRESPGEETRPQPALTPGSRVTELLALPASQREDAILRLVQLEAGRVLSLPSTAEVPRHRSLQSLGADSLMLVELRSALAKSTEVELPPALLAQQLTVDATARYLFDAISTGGESDHPPMGAAHCQQATAADSVGPEFGSAEGASGTAIIARWEKMNSLPHCSVRLFCFHDAGGSPAMFAPFVRLESAGVEVHAIYPSRRVASVPENARQYLYEVVGYMRSLSQCPYALFGHSLGGLIAWRLTQELAAEGARLPILLAPSATFAPGDSQGFTELDANEAFRRIVGNRGQAARNLQRDFLADISLWRAMPQRQQQPLDVPIAAFLGRQDHWVSEDAMRAWSHCTTRGFSLTLLPGTHFYPGEQSPREHLLHELAWRIGDPL